MTGAILIVAKHDRRVRIEVGQGLEGALPDAISNRIITEAITPHFKLGDYDGGVEAGVDKMTLSSTVSRCRADRCHRQQWPAFVPAVPISVRLGQRLTVDDRDHFVDAGFDPPSITQF